jgi:hypothetical protein
MGMNLEGTGITLRSRQYSAPLEQIFDEIFFTSQLFDKHVSEQKIQDFRISEITQSQLQLRQELAMRHGRRD